MKKKQKPILPDPIFSFEDTAIILMHSSCHPHQLAISLNDIFLLNLTRIDDLYIDSGPLPCFFYNDESAWLVYLLVDLPDLSGAHPLMNNYNKMLLVRGRDSWKFQQTFYDELHCRQYGTRMGSVEPDLTELLQHERWAALNDLATEVRRIDIFGFASRKKVSTLRPSISQPTLFPIDDIETNASENRAIESFHKQLQSFLNQTFFSLQYLLCEE